MHQEIRIQDINQEEWNKRGEENQWICVENCDCLSFLHLRWSPEKNRKSMKMCGVKFEKEMKEETKRKWNQNWGKKMKEEQERWKKKWYKSKTWLNEVRHDMNQEIRIQDMNREIWNKRGEGNQWICVENCDCLSFPHLRWSPKKNKKSMAMCGMKIRERGERRDEEKMKHEEWRKNEIDKTRNDTREGERERDMNQRSETRHESRNTNTRNQSRDMKQERRGKSMNLFGKLWLSHISAPPAKPEEEH